MSTSSHWSIYRSFMVAISIIYVIVRIFYPIYHMDNTPSEYLFTQFFQISIDIIFLGILIFIPRKYRMFAMIPLIYFSVSRGAQLINLFTTPLFNELPLLYAIQYMLSNFVHLTTYLTFLILLLPVFKYRMKHFYVVLFLIIPVFMLYALNIFQIMRYMGGTNFFQVLLFSVVFNFVTYFSFIAVFALYILNDIHLKLEPAEK